MNTNLSHRVDYQIFSWLLGLGDFGGRKKQYYEGDVIEFGSLGGANKTNCESVCIVLVDIMCNTVYI